MHLYMFLLVDFIIFIMVYKVYIRKFILIKYDFHIEG